MAALAAAPAPAAADHDDVRVPANAPVVAGPTASGATLVAFARGSDVCIAVQTPREERAATCGEPPRRASHSLSDTAFDSARGVAAHGGLVPADVASVELRVAERTRATNLPRDRGLSVPTATSDAWRGPGSVRFYLADGPAYPPWLYRYRDAEGRTLGARSIDGPDAPVVGQPVTLASGRAGARTWRLRAVRRPRLAATPLDRGRLIEDVCVDVSAGRARPFGGACASVDEPLTEPLRVHPDSECELASLAMLARRDVRRIEAVLGDGRRASVPLTAMPAGAAMAPQAGGLVVTGAVAIRRVEAFDGRGRVLERYDLRLAPSQPCRRDAFFSWGATFIAFAVPAGLETGPLAVRARDEGARLCFSAADFDPHGLDCARPPLAPEDVTLLRRTAGARSLLHAVLPGEVAAVEVPVDGVPRRVETTGDVPGYGGQYRDIVRFLALELPASARVGTARLLDASGGGLGKAELFVPLRPRVVASRRLTVGGLPLVFDDVQPGRGGRRRYGCVRLAGEPADSCRTAATEIVSVLATCTPRRIVVFGEPRRARRIVVRTDRGRVTARIVRVGSRRIYVAVLPPGARPARLVATGRAVRGAELALPPAARQCGYDSYAPVALSRSRPPASAR